MGTPTKGTNMPLSPVLLALALVLLVLCPVSGLQTISGRYVHIQVGDGTFDVKTYGAKGDGKTDDTSAIQAAFDAAGNAGGGTVHFPAGGVYKTRAFAFKSGNTVMNVEGGARVLFDDDHSKYQPQSGDLITIDGAYSHVGLTGAGIVDGQGKKWWEHRDAWRPRQLSVGGGASTCLIQGLTFRNSPNHVLEVYCDNTEIAGVTIFNPPSDSSSISVNGTKGPSHNTDGVDVHGTPFFIHNCHIDTGDDNVAVHASNVLVHDCYFGHGHGASIGSLGDDTRIENVTFDTIKFENTEAAAKIKVRPGANAGYCRNVAWRNLSLKNVEQSISINEFYDSSKSVKTGLLVSDVTIENLVSKGHKTDSGKTVTPGQFVCQPSAACKGITLKHIHHETKEPFHCSEAYGTADDVQPKPCLKKGESSKTDAQWLV